MTETPETWRHKELWLRRSKTFSVEVSCHEEPLSDISPELGPYRWAVYAYIYPEHPHFQNFDGTDSFFQSACSDLPLHGGVISNASYLRYHYTSDGKITCVQVGADYNHLYDERYSHLAPGEGDEVLWDAEVLFAWLTDKASDRTFGADSVIDVSKSSPRLGVTPNPDL